MLHDMVDSHVCSGSIHSLFCNLHVSGIGCEETVHTFCYTDVSGRVGQEHCRSL